MMRDQRMAALGFDTPKAAFIADKKREETVASPFPCFLAQWIVKSEPVAV
jgi:hypothetical protein